jgi:hypothetical protein
LYVDFSKSDSVGSFFSMQIVVPITDRNICFTFSNQLTIHFILLKIERSWIYFWL